MDKKTIIDESDNFSVEYTEVSENEAILTSTKSITEEMLKQCMSSYAGNNKTYSTQVDEQSFMRTSLTEETLERLAFLPQDNLRKVQEINSYIDLYLNKDDIIGRTYEVIEANTNSKYQLKYPNVEGRNKIATMNRVKKRIEAFNEEIELDDLIIETIPYAYTNGNRILYLRKTSNDKYQVERYPLGMTQITSYKINNEPVVAFSLPSLISRMTGSINNISPLSGTAITDFDLRLFPEIEDEIRENFPREIYLAYIDNKNSLVRLNTDLTGVIRVNNRGKRYGVSPIFKALNPALKLEIQEKSDSLNSKARGKKIIFQKISDKLLGENGEDIDLAPTIFSHGELVKAWKGDVVIYTGSPWVESVSYVEPKTDVEHSNALNYYRSKVLSALGISFLNGDSKAGMVVSELNFKELLRVIDKIGKQLAHNINKWYKYVLEDEGLPVEYAPSIEVLDSEMLELQLRMSLTDKLFNSFGMSFQSSYEMLGLDYESEKERRKEENEGNLDVDVFYPRLTNYTFSKANDKDYDYKDDVENKVDNKDKTDPTMNEQVERDSTE